MVRQHITVSVPQPCHEKWQDMIPQATGRHCQSCQKTVVDFTVMSDAEITTWLTRHAGTGCGRFREDQLHRELITPLVKRKTWTWQALMLALAAWINAKPAVAQQPSRSNTTEIQLIPSTVLPAFLPPSVPDEDYISGTAMAGATSQTVTLRLNDTLETKTDFLGHFRLPISRSNPLEKQWLVISAAGFQTQRYRLADLEIGKPLHFFLAPTSQTYDLTGFVGGFVAVRRKWYSPRRLYKRIKSIF